jgi:serine/threonine protein kinase
VHRDLKPENVMVDFCKDDDWIIKVIDWGCGGIIRRSSSGGLGS